MSQSQSSQASLLRRYLLGESSADESRSVETRLMTDLRYLDDLDRAEEELIDDYARGDLGPQENEKFELLFLNDAERREKIEFAQVLNRQLGNSRETPQARFSPALWRRAATGLAAVVVLLSLATAFLYWKTIQVRQQLMKSEFARVDSEKTSKLISDQLKKQQESSQQLEGQLAALRAQLPPPAPDVLMLALTSGWSRGSGNMATATISSSMKRLQLEMAVSLDTPHYEGYQAQIRTVEGTGVWSKDGLKAIQKDGKRFVSVIVPVSAIAGGDYLVLLNGVGSDGKPNEAATYYFRATKKNNLPLAR